MLNTVVFLLLSSHYVHNAYALTTRAPIGDISSSSSSNTRLKRLPQLVELPAELTPAQRLGRALSFYSTVVPVFLSYLSLDKSLSIRRKLLNENIDQSSEDSLYEKLHEWGSEQISNKVQELKGFYVKTGQIISTRVDIFPEQYTSKLSVTQDKLDPVPAQQIRDIIQGELLQGAELSELFAEFDDVPLGSASIAQVHRARLLDGREVAVKVQRPGIQAKLLGDISNLKNFARIVGDNLPLDYYKIFTEIELTLKYELDFLHEAQATAKIAAAVSHSPDNKPQPAPVTVPLPIPGLVTKRVLVMEFIAGTPLSQLAAQMQQRGVKAGSPESKLFGRRLLTALTDAFSAMIFGSGIIHGDPHPGNIFVQEGGRVALLDCGQVKQISTAERIGLANLIVMVDRWETIDREIRSRQPQQQNQQQQPQQQAVSSGGSAAAVETKSLAELQQESKRVVGEIASALREFGVEMKPSANDDCAAALAIVLFGSTDTVLPGGYSGEELSKNSPINQVAEFPSEFILLGRATVMIRGIANRLGIPWSLSQRWAKVAQKAIDAVSPYERLPIWSVAPPVVASTQQRAVSSSSSERPRFREVVAELFSWMRFLQIYLKRKVAHIADKFLPDSTKLWLLRNFARFANFIENRKTRSRNSSGSSSSKSESSSSSSGSGSDHADAGTIASISVVTAPNSK